MHQRDAESASPVYAFWEGRQVAIRPVPAEIPPSEWGPLGVMAGPYESADACASDMLDGTPTGAEARAGRPQGDDEPSLPILSSTAYDFHADDPHARLYVYDEGGNKVLTQRGTGTFVTPPNAAAQRTVCEGGSSLIQRGHMHAGVRDEKAVFDT